MDFSDRSDRNFFHFINTSVLEVLQRRVDATLYVGSRYNDRLAVAGVEPSVGSKFDCYDNALAPGDQPALQGRTEPPLRPL